MSDAQNLIADVLRAHQQADEYGYPVEECRCGATFWCDYAEHVAAEIDKALGTLTRETRVIESVFELGVAEPATRFVSGWMEVQPRSLSGVESMTVRHPAWWSAVTTARTCFLLPRTAGRE
ncbi:hypothetical protein SEA_PHILONIUS_58 [Mycobacterium phage Philonius]|nr:hypothetical protein AVV74_gp58 [Mycobacterium phage Carcharodon]YP_009616912.1 hypothetical protein FDI84_gp59 [Mycobacterium phage Pipsqueaks]YP_010051922.1 hypothetical protein KD928_gp58 [Mycobacterium phage Philonius]YP_010052193.1 hypothetical protein KD932_gp56 [Mycobacterium phage Fulbright]AMS02004.1 hypothetical protein SEA_XERXES_58 [Mycobacterium phage Xerxes]AWY04140.1 hypothetical protein SILVAFIGHTER_59 [Mycobacterium phage Silvafighter]AXQ52628.1 hypothetical protein SEA_GE